MKFGKQILAQQIPGWAQYYLDYKALKKVVSSLSASPNNEAGSSTRPSDLLTRPNDVARAESVQDSLILPSYDHEADRGPTFQAHKTAFFFRLERELEKVNTFYLQKEAELKLRLETLLSKRRAAAARVLPEDGDGTPKDHVEWKAVEEGFHLLERDLVKLQQFIDINATGFRKILKKWDKRSKSTTKELYLSRQVEVQPVFNRQLIAEMSDVVTSCLVDLTDLSIGLSGQGSALNDLVLSHQLSLERTARSAPFLNLETGLLKAVRQNDQGAVQEIIKAADGLYSQEGGKAHVIRILWKGIIEALPPLADFIISNIVVPFDFHFIDDINGRTFLHEAASTGQLRLVDLCLQKMVQIHRADVYGRSALHYAAANGHVDVCRRLISLGVQPASLDIDNFTPLLYAISNGHAECVKALLEDAHVDAEPTSETNDMIPLSLACRVGHVEVVLLLLQHGARSTPNTNGEYPIHIAAGAGHAQICRMLQDYPGWDIPDKYFEWTPVFHAARNGHLECVKVLLELGSRLSVVDEMGKEAVFYAAWYGHLDCVRLLLQAAGPDSTGGVPNNPVQTSPQSDLDISGDLDVDIIPSLSLPPPIMPYRVYGHNYLDKSCLVHVTVGHPFYKFNSHVPAVHLSSRITGPSHALYPHSSTLFKLVMTPRSELSSAPHTVSIPVGDERDIFMFQTSDIDKLTLEFSIYPNFGTKTIGRAIALPNLFQNLHESRSFVLPLLDHHLHVIGEVAFEVFIISPFRGVTLELGGAVETYWKSLSMQLSHAQNKLDNGKSMTNRASGSAYTSPSVRSFNGPNRVLTLSSLLGDYIHLVIQVTRDLEPLAYNEWRLPIKNYDLGIADVTYLQAKSLAERSGRTVKFADKQRTAYEWDAWLSGSFTSLHDILRELPPSIGLFLDLAHPTSSLTERLSLGHRHEPNDFVDSVLRCVYQSAPAHTRRRFAFGSSSPDICAAVNWKQPNYPVFFVSECGIASRNSTSPTMITATDANDRRLTSIDAAVDWARNNNILGVFLSADLLNQVPALVQGVKDAGLLVGAYGSKEETSVWRRSNATDSVSVDAVLHDGVVSYLDHLSQTLL